MITNSTPVTLTMIHANLSVLSVLMDWPWVAALMEGIVLAVRLLTT